MDFLVSNVLSCVVVTFFKITSLKAVCILFQALTALKVIEPFSYKIVRNEGLNNFPFQGGSCVIIA